MRNHRVLNTDLEDAVLVLQRLKKRVNTVVFREVLDEVEKTGHVDHRAAELAREALKKARRQVDEG